MRLLIFLSCFFTVSFSFAQKTILHCGQSIDVKAGTVLKEMTIVVEANTISDIVKGYSTAGKGDKVIDLKNKTVMPGLIDSHVHLEGETSPDQYIRTYTQNPADYAF